MSELASCDPEMAVEILITYHNSLEASLFYIDEKDYVDRLGPDWRYHRRMAVAWIMLASMGVGSTRMETTLRAVYLYDRILSSPKYSSVSLIRGKEIATGIIWISKKHDDTTDDVRLMVDDLTFLIESDTDKIKGKSESTEQRLKDAEIEALTILDHFLSQPTLHDITGAMFCLLKPYWELAAKAQILADYLAMFYVIENVSPQPKIIARVIQIVYLVTSFLSLQDREIWSRILEEVAEKAKFNWLHDIIAPVELREYNEILQAWPDDDGRFRMLRSRLLCLFGSKDILPFEQFMKLELWIEDERSDKWSGLNNIVLESEEEKDILQRPFI